MNMCHEIEKTVNTRIAILISILLVMVTFSVYWQVGSHEFLTYDDNDYVYSNAHVSRGMSCENVVWAFTSVEKCNWFPVTWLSHMFDVQVYGMNPRGHHLTNVVIHCISTLILFFLLIRLTDGLWQSFFVAAMFALHPLHVESVAWVAERKDVLSACFWFLTLFLYSRYVEIQRTKAKSCVAPYLLTLFSFTLGLMSKPMLVTLPVVMLLLDYWPFDRYKKASLYTLTKEKVPFFACSILSSAITIYAQQKGGAMARFDLVPFIIRLQNSLVSYTNYLIKTLWPHDLAVLYPYSFSIPLWLLITSFIILSLISAASMWAGRRYPYLPVGWFWFLVTLLPVIGIIQVGYQSMADRYMYIPAVGLFIMMAWGVPALLRVGQGIGGFQCSARKRGYRKVVLALLASAAIVTTIAVTWRQLGYWKDDVSLYRHTLSVTNGNFIIHYNLALAYGRKGNSGAMIKELQTAVLIKPTENKVRNLLASALGERGDIDAAIAEYRKSLFINQNDKDAQFSQEYWLSRKEKSRER